MMLLADSDSMIIWTAAGSAAAWLGLAISMMYQATKQGREMGALKLQVETMWVSFLRRATSEAVHAGAATMNSPVKVTEQGKLWINGMDKDLRDFYLAIARKPISDRDLAYEIEKHFGERLLKEICIPKGIPFGSALVAAVGAAKETDLIDFDLPSPTNTKELGPQNPPVGGFTPAG